MKKRFTIKALTFLLSVFVLLNAVGVPAGILVEAIDSLPANSASVNADPPGTVPDSIPIVLENPNDVKVNINPYPIFTSDRYERLVAAGLMTGYKTRYATAEGYSPYYTASIGPWFSYEVNRELWGTPSYESKLPYREGREGMLGPDLTVTNSEINVRLVNDIYNYSKQNYRELGSSYIDDVLHLKRDQVSLRVGATLLSGRGYLSGSLADDESYFVSETVDGSEAKTISLDLPMDQIDMWSYVYASATPRGTDGSGVMTDLHMALIDDTAPSMVGATIWRDVREDGSADLVLMMIFNEGLRFSSSHVERLLDWISVDVELQNLETGKKTTARLHIESLSEDGTLVFRGDIGFYNYNNYRVNRIEELNIPGDKYLFESGFVDLADEMYVSPYETKHYDNAIFNTRSDLYKYDPTDTVSSAITDLAGNAINTASITNWSFGDQTYISNTFEAVDVQIYNDVAYGKLLSPEEEKNTRSDLFVGPSNTMSAYLYLDEKLTDEEAKTVSIAFNILNKDGTPLTVHCTSANDYVIDEVYATGQRTGTLLCFESIPLSEGMTLDLPEGSDPSVRIVAMYDEIEGRTAYINVKEPSTTLYADLTAPEAAVRLVGSGTVEPVEEGAPKSYYATMEITVKDVADYTEIAGLVNTKVSVSIGGGVSRDTAVRYILSDTQAVPPADKVAGNYPLGVTLSPNGMSTVKFTANDGSSVINYPILENEATYYLHLFVEQDDIVIDDLYVEVRAEDIAGNTVKTDPPAYIEYFVDEVAPKPKFAGVKREGVMVNEKMRINVTVNMEATDISVIDRMLYYIGEDPNAADADWQVVPIEPGETVTGKITKQYGDDTDESDKLYADILWIKAVDVHGNMSEPVSKHIVLSTQKPITDARSETDLNRVSNAHRIIVTGAPASDLDGSTAYTRVYVTPVDDPTYSYMTIVATGESVNVLGFEGLTWYRVKRSVNDKFTEVSAPETVGENYVLTESSVLYDLFTYYGELKISFENGFGDMVPLTGEYVYSAPDVGSYVADPNYYVARFTSPYDAGTLVHTVDFGAIIDRDDVTVVADADKGAAPYLFNATRKGLNPLRGTQIYFSISNVAKAEYGLMDFDYERSFLQFFYVDADGNETVLATQNGLSAAGTQYFTIPTVGDGGESFDTGAYYLKVTVYSRGGCENVYESSRLVLDAETAEDTGLWSYSRQTVTNITSNSEDRVAWKGEEAEGEPFTDIGVSVTIGGEQMRSSVFAVYSYGATALSIILRSLTAVKSVEGFDLGRVQGFKLWNLASDPTVEEIEARHFERSTSLDGSVYFNRINGLEDIHTADSIPKGADGFDELYLMKGINTICYQYKMENGYVSPIRYFTVTVSEYTPELNIAIDDYRISHKTPDIEGMINAHSVRFFVETAYSLNGTGNVSVDLWSSYGMNVGQWNEGELVDTFYEEPTPEYLGDLQLLRSGLKPEEYADFTKNSYTADFPRYSRLCTALFVATDEYGGVTIVAPQLGDHIRYGTQTGSELDNAYNIDYYGSYYGDPYVIGDSFTAWRVTYNQPQYFGAQLLSFENTLWQNTENGEVEAATLMVSNTEIKYNLFNIVTNDVSWYMPTESDERDGSAVRLHFGGTNLGLVLYDSATVTFSEGDLAELVTVSLRGGEANAAGFVNGYFNADSTEMILILANPRADEAHPAGTKVTRSFEVRAKNRYGDYYTKTGTVTLTYINYNVSTEMTEMGATLTFTFNTLEHGTEMQTGQFDAAADVAYTVTDYYGNRISGTYEVTDPTDSTTSIKVSKAAVTAEPVVITLRRSDGLGLTVDVTDHALMQVTGNKTPFVTVTVLGNTRFSYRYMDSEGYESTYYIDVSNIRTPAPKAVWDYKADDYAETADGTKYRYGDVTVYLVDNSFELIDRYTGKAPSYTFTPGGDTLHVFKAEDILATLNGEKVTLPEDIAVQLPITLYEIPDVLGKNAEDHENPNVQVLAYRMDGTYSETRLALQLENARNSSALTDHYGYTTFAYVGDRATMSMLLDSMGWTPAARFEIETLDMSRVRLFVKAGLYATAPDYEMGVSDVIPGVTLNSKLLTVSTSAKFTLFAVDSHNNVSAVVFDTADIGNAPSPDVVKVTKTDGAGNTFIRAYILPPADSADFEILGSDTVKVESEGEYIGKMYVDYTANDDYQIPYSFLFNEAPVQGMLELNVSEIKYSEIAQVGSVSWSANKADEATPYDVVATIQFNEPVARVEALTDYSDRAVSFSVAGAHVTVTYTANNPELRLVCYAANGTSVTVTLDAVNNINRNAPVIEIVKRELAPNAKSVLITFASNERAMLNGFFGEQGEGGKYYFERRFAKNGEFSYVFVDVTGLSTTFAFTVDELVLDPLSAQYSLTPDGIGAVDSAEKLPVQIGDVFYVNPARDATAELLGGTVIELKSGVWTLVTVPDSYAGVRPYIVMTDIYGNVLTQQFSRVQVPDTTAPEILINHTTYSVRIGSSLEMVRAALLSNFTAIDDGDGTITYEVRVDADLQRMGLYTVEYKATDEAGNVAVRTGRLRVTSLREPEISYKGEKLFRDGSLVLAEGTDVTLDIDSSDLYYKVVLAEGINTVAQSKLYGETVQAYGVGDEIALGELAAGTYTLVILNQERDYFLLYIAIIEPDT